MMRENTAWHDSAKNSRLAIVKKQAWWDTVNGWNSGSGDIDNDKPNGQNIVFGRQSSLAKNLGYQWTFTHLENEKTGGLHKLIEVNAD